MKVKLGQPELMWDSLIKYLFNALIVKGLQTIIKKVVSM